VNNNSFCAVRVDWWLSFICRYSDYPCSSKNFTTHNCEKSQNCEMKNTNWVNFYARGKLSFKMLWWQENYLMAYLYMGWDTNNFFFLHCVLIIWLIKWLDKIVVIFTIKISMGGWGGVISIDNVKSWNMEGLGQISSILSIQWVTSEESREQRVKCEGER